MGACGFYGGSMGVAGYGAGQLLLAGLWGLALSLFCFLIHFHKFIECSILLVQLFFGQPHPSPSVV